MEISRILAWHYSFRGYGKSIVMDNNENQSRPARDAKTSNRGLASADPKTRAEVARKGGEAVSRNREHMANIGRKGGEAVSRDRQHMSEIGRKGGENSRSNDANKGSEIAPGTTGANQRSDGQGRIL